MKRAFILTLIFLFVCVFVSAQQVYNKVGGVCFRVDDHQLAYKWRDFNAVFNKYGYKFSLGLDAQRILPDTAAYNALKEVAAAGHEFMDHTPSSSTSFITFASNNKKDTLWFFGKPGVHHINVATSRICLTIDTFFTEKYIGEGLVDMYGDRIISQNAGEFKDLQSPIYMPFMYFPTKNILANWQSIQNKNQSDPDTVIIRNIYQEVLKLDTVLGIPYHKLTTYDVKMTDEALKLMVERSLYVYDSLGLPRPKSWIQPGGSIPQLSKEEVKAIMGDQYGYTAGATYVAPAYKVYNEVDSTNNKRFALQNPDVSDENLDYNGMIKAIADNSARHITSFTLGHFYTPAHMGGWTGYIARIDSVLNWCKQNNIPVRTLNEWASIFYDSTPNPHANVIPEIHRDLNYNGIPDAYTGFLGIIDSTDGVARSNGKSLTRNAQGGFFSVSNLGGFEKGWNRLSVYTKGTHIKDSVRIGISFPEFAGTLKYYNLGANTPDWKEVSTMIYLDPRASRINISVNALRSVSTGILKISGLQLRKPTIIKIKPGYTQKITTNYTFEPASTDAFVIDSFYTKNEFKTTIGNANQLLITHDTITNTLSIKKPRMFWAGKDSVMVWAANNDNTQDSGYIYFEAGFPSVCTGNPFTIKEIPGYGSNFNWTYKSGNSTGDSVTVIPTQSDWCYVNYTNSNNQPEMDSIFINVDTEIPQITYVKDTLVCHNSKIIFTLPNTGQISWYDSSYTLLTNGSTHTIDSVIAPQKLYIKNRINTCQTTDSVSIQVRETRTSHPKIYSKNTTRGIGASFSLIVPGYTGVSIISSPKNIFVYYSDSIIFNASTNFTGYDSAYFLITDNKCIYDTVLFKVFVDNGITVQETTKEPLTIYPNPARDELTIETQFPAKLQMCTLLGQEVLSRLLDEGKTAISIGHLPNGVYMIKIMVNGLPINKIIIKQ